MHGILSEENRRFAELVRYVEHRPSLNVFDEIQGCAFWQKLQAGG